jgi:drug/metabolite transporter (DMT)-like permease
LADLDPPQLSFMTLQIGILLALACAFATNLGFLYKHRGACAAPAVDIRHPLRSGAGLFSSKWFAIGMAVATGAWVFHVAALAMAPMSVVQAVLSGGVVLLAVMAERLFGLKVGPRQWVGVALTAAGLIMIGITMPHTGSAHSSFNLAGMIAFEAGLLLVGTLLIMGKRLGGPEEHHGVMLGAAAGILFGVSDVGIKAMTGLVGAEGLLPAFLSPWFAVAVIASVAAFYASAKGLQDGDAVPVIAVTGTAANVSCIAGGILVFGDPIPGDALGIVVQAVAFIMVIVASALTPAPVRATGHAPVTA